MALIEYSAQWTKPPQEDIYMSKNCREFVENRVASGSTSTNNLMFYSIGKLQKKIFMGVIFF